MSLSLPLYYSISWVTFSLLPVAPWLSLARSIPLPMPLTLHYNAPHCTALHCTTMHCTAPHCTALHGLPAGCTCTGTWLQGEQGVRCREVREDTSGLVVVAAVVAVGWWWHQESAMKEVAGGGGGLTAARHSGLLVALELGGGEHC